jgi:hypothetical protein
LTPDSTGEAEREDESREDAPPGPHVKGTHLDSLPRDSGLAPRGPTQLEFQLCTRALFPSIPSVFACTVAQHLEPERSHGNPPMNMDGSMAR